MKKILFSIAVIIGLSASVYGQTIATEPEAEPKTLNEKFNFLRNKSNRWENYRVIREASLDQFWRNVQDSVSTLKSDLAAANQRISAQQKVVDEHEGKMESLKNSLAESEYRNNRISFLGIYLARTTYSGIVWGIIGSLLLLLGLGYVRYRTNEKTARKKIKDFEELSEEFEEYRKIVRQREIRIKRDLQTATNKLEEIKHRAGIR